jgi:hypothetical protein
VARLDAIEALARGAGLRLRGAFHIEPGDGVPVPAATLVLLGWVGGADWPAFANAPEADDGAPHPLNRWSRRVIDAMARETGATPLYPFQGPPYLPFQRWAQRAEPVAPSPLGLLIHPDWGLWHSYRGALAFAELLDMPARATRPRPCDSCAGKPCLSTCPVDAFTTSGYDVGACVAHLSSPAGEPCMTGGCVARRACPVGAEHRYGATQAAFHMRAFRGARRHSIRS